MATVRGRTMSVRSLPGSERGHLSGLPAAPMTVAYLFFGTCSSGMFRLAPTALRGTAGKVSLGQWLDLGPHSSDDPASPNKETPSPHPISPWANRIQAREGQQRVSSLPVLSQARQLWEMLCVEDQDVRRRRSASAPPPKAEPLLSQATKPNDTAGRDLEKSGAGRQAEPASESPSQRGIDRIARMRQLVSASRRVGAHEFLRLADLLHQKACALVFGGRGVFDGLLPTRLGSVVRSLWVALRGFVAGRRTMDRALCIILLARSSLTGRAGGSGPCRKGRHHSGIRSLSGTLLRRPT